MDGLAFDSWAWMDFCANGEVECGGLTSSGHQTTQCATPDPDYVTLSSSTFTPTSSRSSRPVTTTRPVSSPTSSADTSTSASASRAQTSSDPVGNLPGQTSAAVINGKSDDGGLSGGAIAGVAIGGAAGAALIGAAIFFAIRYVRSQRQGAAPSTEGYQANSGWGNGPADPQASGHQYIAGQSQMGTNPTYEGYEPNSGFGAAGVAPIHKNGYSPVVGAVEVPAGMAAAAETYNPQDPSKYDPIVGGYHNVPAGAELPVHTPVPPNAGGSPPTELPSSGFVPPPGASHAVELDGGHYTMPK
jgi:hypothetical protein